MSHCDCGGRLQWQKAFNEFMCDGCGMAFTPPVPPEQGPRVSSRNTSVGMLNKPEQGSEPREWWITPYGAHISYLGPDEQSVHVIEKSAYLAVCEERDEALQDRTSFEYVVEMVERERDRLQAVSSSDKGRLRVLSESNDRLKSALAYAKLAISASHEIGSELAVEKLTVIEALERGE